MSLNQPSTPPIRKRPSSTPITLLDTSILCSTTLLDEPPAAKQPSNGSLVQRSASFNASCTVPTKVTASTKVRSSTSFTNCSLIAKVVKGSVIMTPAALVNDKLSSGRHWVLSSNSAKPQEPSGPTCSSPTEATTYSLSVARPNDPACIDYFV